ncbi:UNVERIFIED_CONTAM: hypothetical protein HDU68_011014 [Siphonaria sp. JEL0065]|nr:hypothetical protein HDU68_011014 [Siphonaria sp. JEL0065]
MDPINVHLVPVEANEPLRILPTSPTLTPSNIAQTTLVAYSNRTESLHHFSSESETSDDVDQDSDSDSDATIDDILIIGNRLTLVPPISLDPRMDLESGMYVEGRVVEGFVSEEGFLVFSVDINGRSTRNPIINVSNMRESSGNIGNRPSWQPPPPFPALSNSLASEIQTSSYSLEIPNLSSDSDSDDDDDTWVPLERNSPIVAPETQEPAPVIRLSDSNFSPSPELTTSQAIQLQRRYPRTFNMATATIQQTVIPSETRSMDTQTENSRQQNNSQTTVESDSISRARRIQEIWNDSSVSNGTRMPNTREREREQEIEQISNNLVSSIVDRVLHDLGFSLESFAGGGTGGETREMSFSSFRPNGRIHDHASFPISTNRLHERTSHLRSTEIDQYPNTRRQTHENASNISLSSMNASYEYTHDPEESRTIRRVGGSRSGRIRQDAGAITLPTTGIPSRREFLNAFSPSSGPRRFDDPWTAAVRTFAREMRAAGNTNGYSSQGSTATIAVAAVAAAAAGGVDSDDDSDNDDSHDEERGNLRPMNSGDVFADSIYEWSSRVQVVVTRRLYRPVTPTSNIPNMSVSGVTWERNDSEDSITVQMPLCEWLLTRSLLDANGNVIREGSNERVLSASTNLIDEGSGFQYLDIGIIQRGDEIPDICGFDVPSGGADLLILGLDGNGVRREVGEWFSSSELVDYSFFSSMNEVRDRIADQMLVEVEEAVFERGETMEAPDEFRVGVVQMFGHASVACCTGGRVHSITVDPDEGGLTKFSGGNVYLALPAGYLSSSFFGALMIFCGFNLTAAKVASVFVSICMLATLIWAKNWLTRGITVVFIGIIAFLWWWPFHGGIGLRYFILFLGCMSTLYSLWDICEDLVFRKVNESDAAAFSRICCHGAIPAQVWGVLWFVVSLLFLTIGVVLALYNFKDNGSP